MAIANRVNKVREIQKLIAYRNKFKDRCLVLVKDF